MAVATKTRSTKGKKPARKKVSKSSQSSARRKSKKPSVKRPSVNKSKAKKKITHAVVKKVRAAYDETQLEFADRFDITQGTVSRWEDPGHPSVPKSASAILIRKLALDKGLEI